jgi:N6-adenosine-specific RNA methylase IME4
MNAAPSEKTLLKQAQRKQREQALAGKIRALPDKRYGVIYADPPWEFETYSEKGLDRAAANHYPTMPTNLIKALDVPSIAARHCVLFLWTTTPFLDQALEVMTAWGFEYKTNAVWDKVMCAHGFWFSGRHEQLLVGTRGNVPCPAEGTQWASVLVECRTQHSVKPVQAYELIESYFPNLPRIELFARRARPGWDVWGAEAPSAEAAE